MTKGVIESAQVSRVCLQSSRSCIQTTQVERSATKAHSSHEAGSDAQVVRDDFRAEFHEFK